MEVSIKHTPFNEYIQLSQGREHGTLSLTTQTVSLEVHRYQAIYLYNVSMLLNPYDLYGP